MRNNIKKHLTNQPNSIIFALRKFKIYNLIFTIKNNANPIVSYSFTSKELDSETGLYYFGARYYSSDLSVWLSVDPLSDKYPHVSSYCYVENNPIMRIDPDGRDWYQVLTSEGMHDKNSQPIFFEGSGHREGYINIGSSVLSIDPSGNQRSYNADGSITNSRLLLEFTVGGGNPQGQGGMPGWASDVNTGINAFGVANSAKTELIDYAVRSNYKSARTWSEFNNLRSSQQAWRTTNTLGKTGASYLKYAKGLGYVGAGLTTTYSAANAGMYYYNGGTDWQVGTKATLDVIMTGVGFLGPIGFGISASYFILDATTGGFGGFGQIKP